MSKILILGLPGSGKSTQIEKISEHLKIPSIQMGAILRKIAQEEGELGDKVRLMMAEGKLVDDETVADIIKIECTSSGDSYVLEGYPRTKKQIDLFEPDFDSVFYLDIPMEKARERMVERGRKDDTEEAIQKRFEVQMKDMDYIKNHYQDRLTVIDSTKSIAEVFARILENIK